MRPYLTISCPNPKMRWIFGSQNQTGRIGSTVRIINETQFTHCFLNEFLARKTNQYQRRSLDHVRTRVRCTMASRHADEALKVGQRKIRLVRFTRGGLSSPSLPSISCMNDGMSQTAAVLVPDKYE